MNPVKQAARRWYRQSRVLCFLGFHRVFADTDVPHSYWCARPLCRWSDTGHP